MFPNYKDFQIAVYYTLGKALPKHIEEVQTEIIENFDIKYNSPMLEHPLRRTPIYEKIILRILDTMEDLKRDPLFRRPYPRRSYRNWETTPGRVRKRDKPTVAFHIKGIKKFKASHQRRVRQGIPGT